MVRTYSTKDDPLIFRPAFKLTVLAVCTVLSITVLLWIPGLLTSVLLAVIFVFIFSPAVDFFERHGIERVWAIAIVFFLVLCTIVTVSLTTSQAVIGEYEDFSSRLDAYSDMFSHEINRRTVEFERNLGMDRYSLGDKLTGFAQDKSKAVLSFTGATFGTIMTWVALVPLMLFFFLLDGHRIKKVIIGFLPNRYFEMSLHILQKINNIVGSFIRAKLIESLVVGICALTGFLFVGLFFKPLNYAFFLAIVVGLFNIIPYIGPLFGAVPVLFVAIVQYVLIPQFPEFSGAAGMPPSWAPVIAISCVIVFAQIVDNVYLIPVLLGRSVNVHPLVVLLSVILGAKMLGITGMIISIPLASIVQTMITEVAKGIKLLRH